MKEKFKSYFKNLGDDIGEFADKHPVWFGLTAATWSVYIFVVGAHLVTGKKWDLIEVDKK